MHPSPAPERTSILRRCLLISCSALLAGLWFVALTRPGVAIPIGFWPVQAWATFGLVSSALSRRPLHRRLHFTLALLLLASTWALPAWHLLMPQDQWIAANEPARPGLAQLLAIWEAQAAWLLSLAWVAGLWQACWPAFLIAMPVCTGALLVHAAHPLPPAWSRGLAIAGVVAWLLTVFAATGAWLSVAVSGSPTWFWAILVVGLPFQLRRGRSGVVLAAWGLCVAALLVRLLGWVMAPAGLCDALLALAGGITLACSVAWYARMEAITRFDLEMHARRDAAAPPPAPEAPPPVAFDLIEHLDSPQAQEGADKYTRE